MITRGPLLGDAGTLVAGMPVVDCLRCDADPDELDEHAPEVIATSVAATIAPLVEATRRCPTRSIVAIAAPRAAGVVAPIVAPNGVAARDEEPRVATRLPQLLFCCPRAARTVPVATPEELAASYAAAWTERNDGKRRDLLEACCGPGIRFLQQGAEHEVVGIAALSNTIGEFQAGWPDGIDVRVELTTPVDAHHGFGRGGFVWIFGENRGYGTDFVELGDDGKMKTIVVFGDPGPPPSAAP